MLSAHVLASILALQGSSTLEEPFQRTPGKLPGCTTVEGLIERLTIRGTSYNRMTLPYRARLSPQQSGQQDQWTEEGTVYIDGAEILIDMQHSRLGGETKWYHARWDGAEAVIKSGSDPLNDQDHSALHAVSKDPSWGRFPLSASYLPHNFGVGIAHVHLGSYLKNNVSDVKILGRVNYRGVSCLQVLFDMNRPAGDDGRYDAPWILWIDDTDTLLAFSIQNFLRRKALERRSVPAAEIDGVIVPIEGVDWIPYERWDVLRYELANGVPICTEGRLSCQELFSRGDIIVSVDADRATTGLHTPIPAATAPEGPIHIRDHIRGEDYFLLPDGTRQPHEDARFRSLLEGYASNRGGRVHAVELESPIAWDDSSCGPDAIYFAAHALGGAPHLEELISLVPEAEGTRNVTSLATLGKLAKHVGLEFLVVQTSDIAAIRDFAGVVIVHMEGVGADPGHFGVVDFKPPGQVAIIISPPKTAKAVKYEDLVDNVGIATIMLLSTERGALMKYSASLTDQSKSSLPMNLGILALLVVSAVMTGRILIQRRASSAFMGVLLLVLLGCSEKAEGEENTIYAAGPSSDGHLNSSGTAMSNPREGNSESSLVGEMSRDLGRVDPGKVLVAEFEWMLIGDETVTFRADRASCQCTKFLFLSGRSKPGDILTAEMRAVAPLREGPFQIIGDFDEIHSDGRVVRGSVLLHGIVPHKLNIFTDPPVLTATRTLAVDSMIRLSVELVATSLGNSALPDTVHALTIPSGMTLEIGDPTDRVDEERGYIRSWPVSLQIDISDTRPRDRGDSIRFACGQDHRVGANLRIDWGRVRGYPMERESDSILVSRGKGYSHRVPVRSGGLLKILNSPPDVTCEIVVEDGERFLKLSGVAGTNGAISDSSITLQDADDWPVSYSLIRTIVD